MRCIYGYPCEMWDEREVPEEGEECPNFIAKCETETERDQRIMNGGATVADALSWFKWQAQNVATPMSVATMLARKIIETLEMVNESRPSFDNVKMPVERWKEACKASCSDRNYRSHNGMTETRDDYFVDGVQWADEHPAFTWEDMMHIHKHLKDAMNLHLYELMNGEEGQKKVYQNVLDRFIKERNERYEEDNV